MANPIYGNDLVTIEKGDLNFDLGELDESYEGS